MLERRKRACIRGRKSSKRCCASLKRAATPSLCIRVVDLDCLAAQHVQNVVQPEPVRIHAHVIAFLLTLSLLKLFKDVYAYISRKSVRSLIHTNSMFEDTTNSNESVKYVCAVPAVGV